MTVLKCPSCNAEIQLDDEREFGFCQYCGTKIQLNQTILHKHSGEVKLDGISTVRSLCKKGFMEIEAKDFYAASDTFDKAAEMDCDDIFVIIGKMLTKAKRNSYGQPFATMFDEFFYKRLKGYSDDISKEEMAVINANNCKVFLKCYCVFFDKKRADYVVSRFPNAVGLDLFDTRPETRDYNSLIQSEENPVDVIGYLLDSGCSPEDILKKLFKEAYTEEHTGNDTLNIALFPLNSLKKLVNAGLDPHTEVTVRRSVHNNSGYCDYYNETCKLNEIEKYITLIEKYTTIVSPKDCRHNIARYSMYIKRLGVEKKEKKGCCYIATCVYGSYDCPEVWTLRRFRDNILDKTWYGRLFIKTYYAISPHLVSWFGDSKAFKSFWFRIIDRKVKKLNAMGISDDIYYDK